MMWLLRVIFKANIKPQSFDYQSKVCRSLMESYLFGHAAPVLPHGIFLKDTL